MIKISNKIYSFILFLILGEVSQDMYAIGDLSGKLGYSLERTWDSFLPLSGRYSIFLRSLVIYR